MIRKFKLFSLLLVLLLLAGNTNIVQAQDYQQMATIIRQNMAQLDLYQKVVENARQAVEQFYSLDVYTDKIEAILLDAIQPHG